MSDYGPPGGGQQPFGEPQYPHDTRSTGPYDVTYDEPQYPSGPGSGGQRLLLVGLGAVIVIGLAVLVMALTGVFTPTTTDGPRTVATKLLQASKDQDLDKIKSLVCSDDRDDENLSQLSGSRHATDFSISDVDQVGDDTATVTAKITVNGHDESASLPLRKQGSAWKVCIGASAGLFAGPTPTVPSTFSIPSSSMSIPTDLVPSTTSPDSTVPRSDANDLCASTSSAAETARLFASAITLSSYDLALGCVYERKVSDAAVKALVTSGHVYSPDTADGQTGPTFTFKSAVGSHTLSVTVAKESDGKYYVTAASER